VVSHPGTTLIVNSTITGNQVHAREATRAVASGRESGGIILVNVTVAHNSVDGVGRPRDRLRRVYQPGEHDHRPEFVRVRTPDCSTNPIGHHSQATTCSAPARLFHDAADGRQDRQQRVLPRSPPGGRAGQQRGATPTLALLRGSPAIDGATRVGDEPAARCPAALSPAHDGPARHRAAAAGGCDIGAYEYARAWPRPGAPCSQNGLITVTVTPRRAGSPGGPLPDRRRAEQRRRPRTAGDDPVPQGSHN